MLRYIVTRVSTLYRFSFMEVLLYVSVLFPWDLFLFSSGVQPCVCINKTLFKGKVDPVLLTEHHDMKAYWGSGSIVPLILRPRYCMEVSVQLHVPAAFPPGKEPLVPIG
jgi:hypothetical protein